MRAYRVLFLIQLVALGSFLALHFTPSATNQTLTQTANPLRTGTVQDRQPLNDFQNWTENYATARPDERSSLIAEGLKLAAERRPILAALIESDPGAALRQAVPMPLRQQLPPEVVAQLEERVSDRGELAVIAALPVPGAQDTVRPIDRFARLNGKVYRAYVYGRRLTQASLSDLPLHGIAIDDRLAVDESPVRPLEPGEIPDPRLRVANADEICGISGLPSSRAAAAQVGDEIVYFCTGDHIAAYSQGIIKNESSGPIKASAWTSGIKTMLFMRVNFTDDLTESISAAGATNLMNSVSNWFTETSYNITGIDATITPLLTLPRTKEWYQTNNNNYTALLADARAVALSNGFNTANFNLDCVHLIFVFPGWSGRAYVGTKGAWLQSGGSVGVAAHEFGHNYGLWHANFWDATGDTIIGPGSNDEYGNIFDTMGSANAGDYQFNAYHKNVLGWLTDTNVATITNSGLFRVYAFDTPALSNNFSHALKIQKDSRYYWVELRRKFTSNKWVQNGVLLNWSAWASSAGGSHLLDTTPGSPNGRSDSGVVMGRTFSDPFAGVHITSIRKYTNTSPVSMDVVVNLGTFVDNKKPTVSIDASATVVGPGVPVTFIATASDPEDDPLAYYWDFGDQNFGTNGPGASKSWSSSNDYVVRCTVSDMKGGTASAAVLITVGSPATHRISGRILNGATPVDGARVSVSASIVGYTDGNGDYILTGLANSTNTVTATKAGWVFAPDGFANPVVVGPTVSNINFSATPATYLISGKVTDHNVGIAGATVNLGTNAIVTGGSGNFSFPNLPVGTYILTATKPNYELRSTSGWTNPIPVEWGDALNKNFERPLYSLSGVVSNVSSMPVVSIGDPIHVSNSYSNRGNWNYFLQVPRGQWNLIATLPGYTILPANFTNPVTVTNSISGGQGGTGGPGGNGGGTSFDFTGVVGTTYTLSGTVIESGLGLTGVGLTAGGYSGSSDTAGNYALVGLSNGSYLVTATLTDYDFTPPTRNATINNANLTGQNFLAHLNFRLTQARMTNGGFGFRLSGGSNRVFRIEASTNLGAWSSLATVTNLTGQLDFLDLDSGNSVRIYRAAVLP